MMRTVRVGLVLGLAFLMAAPVLAQAQGGGGGRGRGGRGGGFGAFGGTGMITRALGRLTLSDQEKKDTEEILAANKEKVAELSKEAQLTQEQRGAMRDAMQSARDKGLRGQEMMDFINKEVKRTEKQIKAQKELAALVKEIATKIKGKLSEENQKAFEKMMQPRTRGGGKKKGNNA